MVRCCLFVTKLSIRFDFPVIFLNGIFLFSFSGQPISVDYHRNVARKGGIVQEIVD
jgi:hypothetical protein